MREYGPAIAVSLFIHLLIIGLVGFTWSSAPEIYRAPKIPPYVRAVVMEKPQQASQSKPAVKPKVTPKPKPAKAEEKPVPKPANNSSSQFAQPSMVEMLAQEELQMTEQRAERELSAPAQLESGPSEEELAQLASYEQAVRASINSRWIIPGSLQSQDGLSLYVAIRTLPGGEVIDVNVTKSSGYPVLDDSAVNAIRKASPLPVPSGSSYERFRAFTMHMVPDFAKTE